MFDKIAGRKPSGTVSKKFRLNIFLLFTVFNACFYLCSLSKNNNSFSHCKVIVNN
jgi:hypothetical protein